jgi:hypothetical protein
MAKISESMWGALEAGSASLVTLCEDAIPARVPDASMKTALTKTTLKLSGVLSEFFQEEFKRFGGVLVSLQFSGGKALVKGTMRVNEHKIDLKVVFQFVPGIVLWKMEKVTGVPWSATVTPPEGEPEEISGEVALVTGRVVTMDDIVEAMGIGRIVGNAAKRAPKALGAA